MNGKVIALFSVIVVAIAGLGAAAYILYSNPDDVSDWNPDYGMGYKMTSTIRWTESSVSHTGTFTFETVEYSIDKLVVGVNYKEGGDSYDTTITVTKKTVDGRTVYSSVIGKMEAIQLAYIDAKGGWYAITDADNHLVSKDKDIDGIGKLYELSVNAFACCVRNSAFSGTTIAPTKLFGELNFIDSHIIKMFRIPGGLEHVNDAKYNSDKIYRYSIFSTYDGYTSVIRTDDSSLMNNSYMESYHAVVLSDVEIAGKTFKCVDYTERNAESEYISHECFTMDGTMLLKSYGEAPGITGIVYEIDSITYP